MAEKNAVNGAPRTGEVPPELHVPRPDEAAPADEMTMARAWLNHLREGAVYKLDGLDHEKLRWKPTAGRTPWASS